MGFQRAEEPVGAAAAFGSLFRPEHELNIFQVSLGCSESLGLSIKRVTSTVLKRNPKPRPFYVYPSQRPKRTTFPDTNSNQVRLMSNALLFLDITSVLGLPSSCLPCLKPQGESNRHTARHSECLRGGTMHQPQLPKSSSINTPRWNMECALWQTGKGEPELFTVSETMILAWELLF